MTTYAKLFFDRRCITNLTEEKASYLCALINNLPYIQVWTNSATSGYWSEKPDHSAGDGNSWDTGYAFADAEVAKYDGCFKVEYCGVFAEKVIALLQVHGN